MQATIAARASDGDDKIVAPEKVRDTIVELLVKNGGNVKKTAVDLDILYAEDDDARLAILRIIVAQIKAEEARRAPAAQKVGNAPNFSRSSSARAPSRGFTPPSDANRRAAVRQGGEQARQALLFVFRLQDGRLLAEIAFGELPNIVRTNRREAAILERLIQQYSYVDPQMAVGEVIKPTTFDKVVADIDGGANV